MDSGDHNDYNENGGGNFNDYSSNNNERPSKHESTYGNSSRGKQWVPQKRGQIWKPQNNPNDLKSTGSNSYHNSSKYQSKFNDNAQPFRPKNMDSSTGKSNYYGDQRQKSKPHITGFCAVIRHGERADNVPDSEEMANSIEREYDPPLTPLGIQQSIETAEFMQNFLIQNKYTDIVIESSPFLRSMQTAVELAKVLGHSSIKINYMLTEWMKSTFFSENPLNHLLIRSVTPADSKKGITLEMQKQRVVKEYLGGISIVDESSDPVSEAFQDFHYTYKCYPENWKDMYYQRIKPLQNRMYWSIRNSKPPTDDPDKKTAIICFAHGATVKMFSQVLGFQNNYSSSAGYCAITAMRIDYRKSHMEFDMYDEHINIKRSGSNLTSNIDLSKLSDEEKLQIQMGYVKKISKKKEEIDEGEDCD